MSSLRPKLVRADFRNFRCLKSVSLELGPLTVLVGPNGHGKTSVLSGLSTQEVQPRDTWQHRDDLTAQVDLLLGSRESLSKRVNEPIAPQAKALKITYSTQLLHLDLGALRQPNTTSEAQTLSSTGSNLTNTFATLTRKEQGELAEHFAQLIPTLSDVNARPLGHGQQHLLFQDRWKHDTWYTASEVSDGTMLVLAYLVLQYQRPQVDLLLVEEPERGLHPYLLGSMVSFLRSLSRGEFGPRAVQVVLATHSADLLDHLEPSEVRFLTRNTEDGSVRVDTVPADTPAWQETYRTYDESLGSIWKSGGLRGVPGG